MKRINDRLNYLNSAIQKTMDLYDMGSINNETYKKDIEHLTIRIDEIEFGSGNRYNNLFDCSINDLIESIKTLEEIESNHVEKIRQLTELEKTYLPLTEEITEKSDCIEISYVPKLGTIEISDNNTDNHIGLTLEDIQEIVQIARERNFKIANRIDLK
jgi:hypothetical protein